MQSHAPGTGSGGRDASTARGALGLAAAACLVWLTAGPSPISSAQEPPRPAGWSERTHGEEAAPDYDLVFATDRVHELHVTIAPADFEAMQQNLATIGPAGFGRGGRGAPFPFPPGGRGGGFDAGGRVGRGRGGFQLIVSDPIYVPVSVTYDGRTWPGVGMRYKGNSSLMTASMQNGGKVPFRLDFDRYEDEVPGTKDQRFHGFGKLTFSSNFSDDSMLKEVLATEVFRDRGVPAARAAFYRVFVDTGDGDEYWGLYTMIEDPADGAMLDAQFGGRDGNLYKPEGPGADWTYFDEAGFPKKTNERDADFTDVRAAIEALNAPQDDPAAWRAGLEATLDVDGFLRWLAVNTAIENWDAYGAMSHNYYLYGEPGDGGRLRWIPWDHNMSFGMAGGGFPGGRGRGAGFARGGGFPGGGFPGVGAGARGDVPPVAFGGRGGPFGRGGSVLHDEAGSAWPLISRVLADEVYQARYRTLLGGALEGLFARPSFEARARELHALVAPFVVGEQGERPTHTTLSAPDAFERALDGENGLLAAVERRRARIRQALGIREP